MKYVQFPVNTVFDVVMRSFIDFLAYAITIIGIRNSVIAVVLSRVILMR